ncbi:alpha/beta hydrolase fold domain-containing protein [Isoptericola sediminis]|uniref:Alpha/beta hydrolase n=1 Tax=Isoptericola sediminis TaxID=2733572 RepID=A0A849KCQ3_9MICO|nr:alpha/beta hydrolase [Isoptericola sediminis]
MTAPDTRPDQEPTSAATAGPGRPSRGGGLAVGVLLAVALPLAVLSSGALVPGTPWWGHVGVAVSPWAVWFVAAGIVVVVLGTIALLRRASVARVLVLAAGVVTTVCAFVVVTQQLLVAQHHDVAVRIGELFAVSRGDVSADLHATYGQQDGEAQELSVWLPRTGGDDAPAPVVVLVHGGGWATENRLQPTTASHAAWFAQQGFLAVSVDYPLSDDEHHRWDVVEPQVACALVWVGRHAAEHGGDGTAVHLAGDSAGGNVALDVAYRATTGEIEPACPGDLPRVAAVSTLFPVADPVAFHDNTDPVVGSRARVLAERYTGGTPTEVPERYAAVTPAEHVAAGAPATLMMLGTADRLVPPAGAQDLADVLARHGVEHELVELPRAGHAFDVAPGGVGTQTWRELTLRWFSGS